MSKDRADKLFMLGRYLAFLRQAGSRYDVHSPYVYRIVEEVIRPGYPHAICGPVEELRKKMRNEKRLLHKTDLGSGGTNEGKESYPVRISRLARSSSLPSKRASRLFHLVRFLKAATVLELGTSLGISAAYMARANPRARVITLEGCPEVAEQARRNMEGLGLNNVQVVTGPFRETLPEALSSLERIDLVFMDGDHREGPTLEYFHQCLPFVHQDSVIVIDDIHYSRGMERAWDDIREHPRVTVSIDLFHQGWVLMKKELSPQRFILRYP